METKHPRPHDADENDHGLGVGITCSHCDGYGTHKNGHMCKWCDGTGVVTSYRDGTIEYANGKRTLP